MIDAIIRGLLGSLEPIYDYILSHPTLVTIVLAILVSIYLAGLFQLKSVEKKTREFVLDLVPDLVKSKPHITTSGIYKHVLPRWQKELKSWKILFIPHRLDIWPIPATASNIITKMKFSPEWIKELLKENNVLLDEFINK
jgi:hypothetical protein